MGCQEFSACRSPTHISCSCSASKACHTSWGCRVAPFLMLERWGRSLSAHREVPELAHMKSLNATTQQRHQMSPGPRGAPHPNDVDISDPKKQDLCSWTGRSPCISQGLKHCAWYIVGHHQVFVHQNKEWIEELLANSRIQRGKFHIIFPFHCFGEVT